MVLQNILFSRKSICKNKDMYFRYKDAEVSFAYYPNRLEAEMIFLAEGSTLKTDTYFNSFSIYKWKKYTQIDHLDLRIIIHGSFTLKFYNVVRFNNENVITELCSYTVNEPDKATHTFEIPIEDCTDGLVYFELVAAEPESVFYNGSYCTKTDVVNPAAVNPVKFAIDICTYKREKFIIENIKKIRERIIDNPNSPLFGKLDLYISDNGQSLDYDSLNDKHVFVFPNKNLGGAGGFGRCMYEILQNKYKNGYTHIIMMDDDVRLDPNVLERNYAFLRLLKPDYNDAFIGGAMLRLDNEWMQSESGDIWYQTNTKPIKYKYDLRKIMWLLKNEKEDTVNHFGWWYCCMPISVVKSNNLPLPIFIKRDDIEYGLRNGRHFINLNGICVWHEPFEAKRSPYLDYYYYRNQSIINSRHRPEFDSEEMLKYYDTIVEDLIEQDIYAYRYREAHIKLQGIDDFLKGIDWLKSQDGEAINRAVLRWTYKLKPVDQLNGTFIHGLYERSLKFKETKEQTAKRKKTHNGWDEPPKKNLVIAPLKDSSAVTCLTCGAKRVLYYDEVSNKGYIAVRSDTQRQNVLKHFNLTRQNIIDNYDRVKEEYDSRFEELTCREFWEKYLFDDNSCEEKPVVKEWWEKIGNFTDERIQKGKEKLNETQKEINRLKLKGVLRPIKNNRVVFYIANRHGLSCNIKYILTELVKEAGTKLDIILVSDYPESCSKASSMGVKVVQSDTEEHKYFNLTAKVIITNDDLPAYFVKRKGQTVINTWHAAMNYKTIGPDFLQPRTEEEMQIYLMENRQPDFYLSGSRFFSENTAESFHYDPKIFLPTGMARNDIFFSDYSEIVKKIRKIYNISDDKKIALYAPTFRKGFKSNDIIFDFRRFKKALSQRFGGDWIILYRGHYFVKNNPKTESIDVSRYDDMQELMCAADILVSDYSSCLWDFTFTGRPAFVFASDLNEYIEEDRGFALPIKLWPYPVSTNTEELCDVILNFDWEEYNEKVKLHHEREGSYEKGSSARAACELILKQVGID